MSVITAIRKGLPGLISHIILLIILLIVFIVPTTTAAQKDLLSKMVISAAEEAPQTTIPPDLVSFATSKALPGIMAASFNAHPLLGYSPKPLYSQDGGLSWHPVYTTPWADDPSVGYLKVAVAPRDDPNAPVRLLVAVSSTDPAKVGVYRTGDYGKTSWTFIHFGFLHPECTLGGFTEFVASPADPKRLYLVNYCEQDIFGGYRNFLALFTSSDSGITWQAISPLPSDIGSLNITPSPSIAGRVYTMGQNGHWYQSDDSGLHWTPKNFPSSPLVLDAKDPARLYNLDFYIGRRSTDEGKTWVDWVEQPCLGSSNDNNQLLAHPTQSQVLLLRCASSLFRSNDGGDHWVKLSPWQGQRLEPDYGNPGRILWVRNDGLWATHNSGDTWTHLANNYQTKASPWQNVSTPDPVGALYAITALSPTNIWAVGADGLILRWQGQEWLPVDSPVTASLFSIAFASPNDGWAVGDQTILHWDGNAWTPVPHPTIGILKSVDVLSANNAWAVGSNGVILHWDGQSWQGVSSPTTLPLESVDIVSPVDGWAVGGLEVFPDVNYTGIILHWNGVDWTPFMTTPYILRSVDMLSGSEGWIVGNPFAGATQILRWNGTNWEEFPHPRGVELASVSMVSANEGWAVGSSTVLYWDGQSWISNPVSTELRTSSVTTLPTGEAWLTSYENGWLLRYQTLRELYLPQIRK